jgi:UDP-N-acetylglucosamine 1-carboxyvinyltransferase
MNADAFKVVGGEILKGSIQPQGAKNEALQVLCATLLTHEPVTISNVPDILDVRKLLALLKGLGVKVQKNEKGSFTLQADDIDLDYFESEEFHENARRIRGSVMLIGPLLARYGRAYLPKPGGDKIGRRRLGHPFSRIKKTGRHL